MKDVVKCFKMRPIRLNELDAVLRMFAENFFDDVYYLGAYADKASMEDDFRECMTWILENGNNVGVYDRDSIIGMALSFPLDKLDDHMFGEFFGEEGVLYNEMKAHLDSTFLFAICIDHDYRGMFIGSRLFEAILDDDKSYIGDTTGIISLGMCQRRGFECKPFNENDSWWNRVYRPALKNNI